jgi:chemotaxis protein histidine kinase CheA
MADNDPDVLAAFAEECAERLQGLEDGLLILEREAAAPPPGLLDALFRHAHSVKAGAGLLGLRGLEHAAHSLENVLDALRKGTLSTTEEVISALLDGVDLLRDLLGDGGSPQDLRRKLEALHNFI